MTDWGRSGDEPPQGGYQGPPATGQYPPEPRYPSGPAAAPGSPYPAANPYAQVAPYGYGYPPGYAPGYPAGNGRPGTIIAAAVLGYVTAGLLILSGSLLVFGASIVSDVERAAGSFTDYGTELALDGLLNMVAAGLLIAGAVMMTGRKANGRTLLSVGGAIVLAETLYWLIRFSGLSADGFIFYAVLFAALSVIALSLAWTPGGSAWLRGAR